MASRGAAAEIPVFTDTNLGTHFAMAISPHMTVPEFKRELESKHLSCFPNIGRIRVNSLMVKRKSRLYHLSESFPLKYAFMDFTRAYFFHIEVCHESSSDKVGLSDHVAEKERETCVVSTKCNTKCKRKNRRLKRFHGHHTILQEVLSAGHLLKKRKKKKKCLEKNFVQNYPIKGLERFGLFASRTESERRQDWNFSPLNETRSDMSSESVSVSGIIKKYFLNSDELTSSSEVNFAGIRTWPEEQLKVRTDDNCSGPQIDTAPEFSATTPPEIIVFPFPSHSSSKTSTGVGKRLIIASNNLRISQSKQKPTVSLCSRFSNKKLTKSSFVRSLVFEISGADD